MKIHRGILYGLLNYILNSDESQEKEECILRLLSALLDKFNL